MPVGIPALSRRNAGSTVRRGPLETVILPNSWPAEAGDGLGLRSRRTSPRFILDTAAAYSSGIRRFRLSTWRSQPFFPGPSRSRLRIGAFPRSSLPRPRISLKLRWSSHMLVLQLALLLCLLLLCSLAPGFYCVRRLPWSPMEKLSGGIGLSLVLLYLASWGIYCFIPRETGGAFAAVSLICACWASSPAKTSPPCSVPFAFAARSRVRPSCSCGRW